MNIRRSVPLLALTLAGCDDVQRTSEPLARCLASTEQTVLLRQLNLRDEVKKVFEFCRTTTKNDAGCQALYLNANVPVQQCMKDAGYTFLDIDFYLQHKENPYKVGDVMKGGELKDDVCDWQKYQDASCYHRTWWFKLTHWWAL